MNIMLDNIIFELQRQGGISVYWRELSDRLKLSKDSINEVTPSLKFLPAVAGRMLPEFRPHSLKGPFIFHSSYYRINLHPRALNIVTVFDFTHRRLGRGLKNEIFLQQQAFAISRSSRIICISNSTKDDLLHYFPHINPNKVDVVYVGVSQAFCRKREEGIKIVDGARKYVLFVGSRASYKNFNSAVLAIKSQPVDFVVAGPSSLTSTETEYLNSHIPGRWSFIESPSTERLQSLYQNALCLIYPSSYEGFGIPVLEGALCGIPVIACKNSSIPEVAGPSTLLVDEPNVELLSAALSNIISGDWLPNHHAGASHAAKFSWDKCFEETLKSYKRAFVQ